MPKRRVKEEQTASDAQLLADNPIIKKRRQNIYATPEQLEILKCIFEETKLPNASQITDIVEKTGLTKTWIVSWFQRKRSKTVTKKKPVVKTEDNVESSSCQALKSVPSSSVTGPADRNATGYNTRLTVRQASRVQPPATSRLSRRRKPKDIVPLPTPPCSSPSLVFDAVTNDSDGLSSDPVDPSQVYQGRRLLSPLFAPLVSSPSPLTEPVVNASNHRDKIAAHIPTRQGKHGHQDSRHASAAVSSSHLSESLTTTSNPQEGISAHIVNKQMKNNYPDSRPSYPCVDAAPFHFPVAIPNPQDGISAHTVNEEWKNSYPNSRPMYPSVAPASSTFSTSLDAPIPYDTMIHIYNEQQKDIYQAFRSRPFSLAYGYSPQQQPDENLPASGTLGHVLDTRPHQIFNVHPFPCLESTATPIASQIFDPIFASQASNYLQDVSNINFTQSPYVPFPTPDYTLPEISTLQQNQAYSRQLSYPTVPSGTDFIRGSGYSNYPNYPTLIAQNHWPSTFPHTALHYPQQSYPQMPSRSDLDYGFSLSGPSNNTIPTAQSRQLPVLTNNDGTSAQLSHGLAYDLPPCFFLKQEEEEGHYAMLLKIKDHMQSTATSDVNHSSGSSASLSFQNPLSFLPLSIDDGTPFSSVSENDCTCIDEALILLHPDTRATDPFQAAMDLVYLARRGLKWN